VKIVKVADQDTGNQSYKLAQAINAHTEHRARAFVRSAPLGWPADVVWREEWGGRVPAWIQQYWAKADVIHVSGGWKKKNYWCPWQPNVAWVFHQHGRRGRSILNAELKVDRQRKAVRVVSTFNLLPYVNWDASRWVPSPMLIFYRKPFKKGGRLRIVHSPTVTADKQTREFKIVMEQLVGRYDVEYEIITGVTNTEVLCHKATADIVFDQLHPCFGTNALEAWALGIPAVVGMSDEVDCFIEDYIGYRPYVRATTVDELYNALEQLITDATYRALMGKLGWEYVNKYHHPKRVAAKVIEIYREAIGRQK
jgi:hypothetical protein